MKMKNTKNLQAGSVLLEALISILIFSIGILALIGMQATAINGVSDSKYRSTAGFLADQMVGTIWANRLASSAVSASNVMAAIPDSSFSCNPCGVSGGNAYTNAWAANSVATALPKGNASIAIAGAAVTVSIGWQAPKDTAAHSHVVVTYIN